MSENPNVEIIDTDIVIVGGGGTGLCAGVSALQCGVRDVTILEQRNNTGGNTQYAYGFFASESPLQKAEGIDDTNELFFRVAMDYAGWQVNGDVLRAYINKSGSTVQWLMDMGIKVELNHLVRTQFNFTVPRNWHKIVDVGGLGGGATRVLREKFDELGGKVITKTRGRKLLKDETGRITGVLATSRGKKLQVNAKCVILGTGGFGGNPDKFKEVFDWYTPETVITTYPVYCMGDGLAMAQEAGADTEGMGRIKIEPKGWKDAPREVWILAIQPESVWLDKRGRRFTDEATYIQRGAGGFHSVLELWRKYHDMTNYTVFDDGMVRRILALQEDPEIKHMHYQNLMQGYDIARKSLDDILKSEAEKGSLIISDSWDEIAGYMSVPPEDLKETIAAYNESCKNGRDPLMAKDAKNLAALDKPPYYCVKCMPRYLNPTGGIKINENMQPLDYNGEPIRGLYAGGIDTGGWEAETYNILLNGSFFSFALNSGRIAGENAAKYVLNR